MKREPRGRKSGMMSEILIFSLIAGIISFAATMIFFLQFDPVALIAAAAGDPVYEPVLKTARTLALTVSVLFELFQVFVSKAPDDKSIFMSNPFNNIYLLIAVGLAFFLHLFIVYYPPIAAIFGFVSLTLLDWAAMLIIVLAGVIILDLTKQIQSRIAKRSSSA
jgi:magnesium-transporting ATPase (P-type)